MLTLATQVPRILDQINAGQEWANVKDDNSHRTDVKIRSVMPYTLEDDK